MTADRDSPSAGPLLALGGLGAKPRSGGKPPVRPAGLGPAGIALMVLASAAAYPVGLAIGVRWLLPVLNTVPAYVAMVVLLRRGRRDGAVWAMLLWAATLA